MKERTIPPEQAVIYSRLMDWLERAAEKSAPEMFRWLGWSTALAAVQVVAIRTGSMLLALIPFIFAFFVSGRIQWCLGLKHPEERRPDGSIVVRFKWWRMLFVPVGWAVTYFIVFAVAHRIAVSDLLPPREGVATPACVKLSAAKGAQAPSPTPQRP